MAKPNVYKKDRNKRKKAKARMTPEKRQERKRQRHVKKFGNAGYHAPKAKVAK